jgi:leucyl-tRNA synthetase
LLSPFTPHIAEEMWQKFGKTTSIVHEPWPSYDEKSTVEEQVEVVLQVNGKVRSHMLLPKDTTEEDARSLALADPKIQELIAGKKVVKVVYVPRKLINIVVA